MKRNKVKKLSLNRETLRSLDESRLAQAQAAVAVAMTIVPITITLVTCPSRRFPCTNELSVCITCTTPIDGCPDPTVA